MNTASYYESNDELFTQSETQLESVVCEKHTNFKFSSEEVKEIKDNQNSNKKRTRRAPEERI